MKKTILFFSFLTIGLLILGSRCHKQKMDPGCGCKTDSVWHYVTYNNFGGYAYRAGLFYDTFQKQNDWFVSVGIPGTNNGALLKICNKELPSVRAITDTISNKYQGVPILFSGKLKKLCQGESFGIQFPETITAYLIIDSLKKN